jgi:hypothetical protein
MPVDYSILVFNYLFLYFEQLDSFFGKKSQIIAANRWQDSFHWYKKYKAVAWVSERAT